MTVSKAIVKWLAGYGVKPIKISTDQVGEGADSLGLFKSPNRETENFNDAAYRITEYYQLYVIRDGQEDRDRCDNDEWLENFAYWVDDCGCSGNLPVLNNNRTCEMIALSGTPYMMEARENSTALYQMSLKITYRREREEAKEW